MTAADVAEVERWYAQYGKLLLRRCTRILGDSGAAEDCLQDVFTAALRHRSTFARRAEPLHWLQKITTRMCLRHLRSESDVRARTTELDELSGPLIRPDGTVDRTIRRDLVRKLLARFDERTQAVAVAIYIEEMRQDEISVVLGISERAVRKRLANFKKRARRLLTDLERNEPLRGRAHVHS